MLDRALESLMNIGFGVLAKELKSQPGLRIEDLLMTDAVTSPTHPTASCARLRAHWHYMANSMDRLLFARVYRARRNFWRRFWMRLSPNEN